MMPKCLWRLSLAGVALVFNMASVAESANYVSEAVSAIQALNHFFYNQGTGLWDDAWWNSANALHTLAIFTSLRPSQAAQLNLPGLIHNTYVKAQQTSVQTVKFIDLFGMTKTTNRIGPAAPGQTNLAGRSRLGARGFSNFLNDYFDDEGWWCGGLVAAYDATGNTDYLNSAVEIFQDIQQTGQGTPCGGGIWWSRDRTYVNAIANELYLHCAASLANRVSASTYGPVAEQQWAWFNRSGMINGQFLINDGLDANCQNNGLTTWTYNQGVILGGLVELYQLTKDTSLLSTAVAIANAAISNLSNANGILQEADHCEQTANGCGMDGAQFKGIFVRFLAQLNEIVQSSKYYNFLLANADSIWNNDRNQDNLFGVSWPGPFSNASGPSDSSALDAIVAAITVTS